MEVGKLVFTADPGGLPITHLLYYAFIMNFEFIDFDYKYRYRFGEQIVYDA